VIIEWLMSLAANLFDWMFSGLPAYTPPTWITGLSGAVAQVFAVAGSMGVWFPAPLVLSILLALLTFWVVSFGIKVIRLVVSLFTGGGGSAA
jgi:hypothetical protein